MRYVRVPSPHDSVTPLGNRHWLFPARQALSCGATRAQKYNELIRQDTSEPVRHKRRSRLASFGLALFGVALVLTGALLVILGTSGLFDTSLFGIGLPSELPGLIIVGCGFFTLFRAGRPAGG